MSRIQQQATDTQCSLLYSYLYNIYLVKEKIGCMWHFGMNGLCFLLGLINLSGQYAADQLQL